MAVGRLQSFPWYGGKFYHLDFILPRLPDTNQYVEPFGGSAVVLLSREPANVETYNDLDGDVTTFFRVLRDRTDELVEALERTPYSREEYLQSIEAAGDDSLDDLERARLFYVRAVQVYAGLAQSATPGRWSYAIESSNRGMSNPVSKWWTNIEGLEQVADRLRPVQIEHDDALAVVDRYDSPDTLFYCDPPYPLADRTAGATAYVNELGEDDHRELGEALRDADAKVAVSSYQNPLYDELFDGWHVTADDPKAIRTRHHTDHDDRVEVLYTNYDPAGVHPQRQAGLDGFANVADVGGDPE